MLQTKRLVLDVLKPHQPNILEFARIIAERLEGSHVKLKVMEMDDKTETLEIVIEGVDLQLEIITAAIAELGGSLHSIDGVEVVNTVTEPS